MPVDSTQFRSAMGRLATGVTVVVARRPDGTLVGMTASAVASLSLDPPMVLVCVGQGATLHDVIVQGAAFNVNVLAAGQEAISRRFAARGAKRFDDFPVEWTPAGLPRIPGAPVCLECRTDATYSGGDHTIVTGTVEWAWVGEGEPLLYYLGEYRRLGA